VSSSFSKLEKVLIEESFKDNQEETFFSVIDEESQDPLLTTERVNSVNQLGLY
jgi:hypothetical protein